MPESAEHVRRPVHRPFPPVAYHGVRDIVGSLADVLTVASAHVHVASTASRERPINRHAELQQAHESLLHCIVLARQLAALIVPMMPVEEVEERPQAP